MASGLALGLQGKDELLDALGKLPAELQRKVLRKWTKRQADKVVTRAKGLAPSKTGRLRQGIVARNSGAATLRKKGSLARSVAIGKKPAFHFHLINLGTRQRTNKKGARRGRVTANAFLEAAARPVIAEALADASTGLAAEVERALQAALKRTARRAKG